MSSYFSTIPTELIKAARIDGCSWINVLFKVILPNSIPGIVAVLIIEFIEVWNEFIGALVLTETMASKTLPVVLAEFTSLTGVDYGGLAAGAIITSIPAFVFALIFQKYIVRGLTAGAVKG
jgi:multiple sugar transport system permease protein